MATAFPFHDSFGEDEYFTMGVRTLNRIIWTCFTRVRLAAYIVGLVVAIDASVLLHAILSDEIVSQVRQGTESITGEVFQFCNLWYVNKGLGNAKQLLFVFGVAVQAGPRQHGGAAGDACCGAHGAAGAVVLPGH